MIAQTVLVRPSAWNSMYSGTVSRATGRRSPAMITPTAMRLPGNANFAIAYPAMTANSVPMTPALTEYSRELPTHRQNSPCVQPIRLS